MHRCNRVQASKKNRQGKTIPVIGGMQAHQHIRIDGICPALPAAMGLGGTLPNDIFYEGIREKVKAINGVYYDVYNKRWVQKNWFGTVSTHGQDGHSGTFYLLCVGKRGKGKQTPVR